MYEILKKIEFFSLNKLAQGHVIVNLGIEGKEDFSESISVEMNWVTQAQIKENADLLEKKLLNDDPRGFTQDQLKTYVLAAETLSQASGWFYVGMLTINPDRTFLGLHDMKTVPTIVNGKFQKIEG